MTLLTRKAFIKKMLRWGLAGVLSGSGLYLLGRSHQNDHQCINTNSLCRSCRKNRDCVLPQAMSFRKLLKKKSRRAG